MQYFKDIIFNLNSHEKDNWYKFLVFGKRIQYTWKVNTDGEIGGTVQK